MMFQMRTDSERTSREGRERLGVRGSILEEAGAADGERAAAEGFTRASLYEYTACI
jgi:hypothetical protein